MSVLVAGVGNIFCGDDAFGVEVAQRLAKTEMPPHVRVVDFGIRGFDLAFALMDQPDLAILVDAVSRGGAPGTLYTIEHEDDGLVSGAAMDGHGMNPAAVFGLVHRMGGSLGRVIVVGCEPAAIETPEDGHMGLTPPVASAVDGAISIIEALIRNEFANQPMQEAS